MAFYFTCLKKKFTPRRKTYSVFRKINTVFKNASTVFIFVNTAILKNLTIFAAKHTENDTVEQGNIIEITSIHDEAIRPYTALTEAQLRTAVVADATSAEENGGLFIAESPKVITTALNAGYEPVSLLCEKRHITGDAAEIIRRCPGMAVYTGERQLLSAITGYTLTRGVLCAMKRRRLPTVEEAVAGKRRIVVIDSVVDSTNIGAIFRSAAALGIDAVLLTHGSCDALNRRCVRVSMGSVFLVPWTWMNDYDELRCLGFHTAAMALTERSVPIDDTLLAAEEQLAIIVGSEGYGLPAETIAAADYVVRIPMYNGVDSLNVAAAAAIAFWQLRVR